MVSVAPLGRSGRAIISPEATCEERLPSITMCSAPMGPRTTMGTKSPPSPLPSTSATSALRRASMLSPRLRLVSVPWPPMRTGTVDRAATRGSRSLVSRPLSPVSTVGVSPLLLSLRLIASAPTPLICNVSPLCATSHPICSATRRAANESPHTAKFSTTLSPSASIAHTTALCAALLVAGTDTLWGNPAGVNSSPPRSIAPNLWAVSCPGAVECSSLGAT